MANQQWHVGQRIRGRTQLYGVLPGVITMVKSGGIMVSLKRPDRSSYVTRYMRDEGLKDWLFPDILKYDLVNMEKPNETTPISSSLHSQVAQASRFGDLIAVRTADTGGLSTTESYPF